MADKNSITDLNGVYGAALAAGIKATGGLDLSYLYIPNAQGAAAVFTKNHFPAAPIIYSKECFAKGIVKAVVVNAGNANACTGEEGLNHTRRTAQVAAELLSLRPEEVAVASTGIIGVPLPIEKVENGLVQLLKNPEQKNGSAVAEAILTTDTCAKTVSLSGKIGGLDITVSGITKGSGMIAPNMATMLGFMVTDAGINSENLTALLREAVSDSFNMITVDSDTSTNDVVMLFSSGEKQLNLAQGKNREEFLTLLTAACVDLAKKIVIDGEGAEKLITVSITGAASVSDAKLIALSVANSPLVKTAIHGADPNWGRILMAVGKTPDVKVIPEKVNLSFCGVDVLLNGAPVKFDRGGLSNMLKNTAVEVEVALNIGNSTATVWGCDLTKRYVDINVAYS